MKKKLLALLLAGVLMLSNVAAVDTYTPLDKTADALNHLGLLAGDGISYDLDASLRRDVGITLLVNMIGKGELDNSGNDFGMPFNDVPDWARSFVGYAWANQITSGVSADRFGSEMEMTDYMFLTMILKALGYVNTGDNAQFVWDDPFAFAYSVGLTDSADPDKAFSRGDAVDVFWNAMDVKFNGSEKTLSEKMIEQGAFTAQEFEKAEEIQEKGRDKYQGVPAQPEVDKEEEGPSGSTPSAPSAPSSPSVPSAPSETEKPVKPEQPTKPEVPAEPEQPAEPEVPAEPEQPAEPEAPAEPEVPAEPEQPAEPEGPEEPEQPAESEIPAEPSGPTDSTDDTEDESTASTGKDQWETDEF